MTFLAKHTSFLTAVLLMVLPGVAVFPSALGAQDDAPAPVQADPPSQGTAHYGGPISLNDPQDPFQSVNWTLGVTLPRRSRLGMGSRSVTPRLEYDLDRDVVLISYHSGNETVLPSRSMTRAQFAELAIQDQLRRTWIESNRRVVAEAQGGGSDGINLNLGVELPFTEKLFGPGAPNLRVTGSEQITFSGTSTWVKNQVTGERGGGSLFPKLDMRQRLDVGLQGTIGTKLSIDVRQNSDALTPLENAIRIRYRGEEDEVIQNIELGNTNLSLPRSQFVSISSRTEGLFGIKADGQVGDVLWTGIASRQEGETGAANIVGGATDETRRVEDWRFQPRRFFFVANPTEPEPSIVGGTLRVYLDDRNPDNDNEMGARGARVWLSPGTAPAFPDRLPSKPHRGSFHLLEDVIDYSFVLSEVYQFPILRLSSSLSPDQVLAVSYDVINSQGQRVSVGFIPEAPTDSLDLKMIRPGVGVEGWGEDVTVGPWAPARRLELKNIYSLGARNIDSESFELSIELDRGGNNPVVITNEFGKTTSLMEVLGLDQRDNLQVDRFVPDGKVDPEYIDYTEGLLLFPDLRPFDPDTTDIAGVNPLKFPVSDVSRLRERSWPVVPTQGRPDTLGWNLNPAGTDAWTRMRRSNSQFVVAETAPGIYDKRSDVLSREQAKIHKYTIVARMRSAVSTIPLNALGDILQGSETVRLDGRELERNIDYRINYESGIIELLNEEARLPGARLDVSYSYDSPFSRGSRSLMGLNLTRNASPSAPFTYSTSWLHESRGVPDQRPRLGQEPTKTTVGDLAAQVRLSPWGLTRLADSIPFVRTTAPSRVDLSGALGLSLPNPNTRGVVYVDDMEGAETVTAASLSRVVWFYSSAPERAIEFVGGTALDVTPKPTDRGQILWFSPNTVRVKDINPREDSRNAADDLVPALEVVYVPYERAGVNGSWAGLSAPLSFEGVDLTQAQFIEVWVNDFKGYANRRDERRGELLIDIGSISEDAIWDPLTPPAAANRRLDVEDRNRSGGRIEENEDTGLDGEFSARNSTSSSVPNETEVPGDTRQGFSTYNRSQDPSGDDRQPEINTSAKEETLTQRIAKFAGINGTERNEFPDSEDLDDDAVLDLDNNYLEYRISLADEALTDNGRDFPPASDATPQAIDENGWRLYRIPLNDFHQELGVVDLSLVKNIRLWFRGVDPGDTLDVQIASVEIVGNRWEISDELPDPNNEPGREFRVAVVNNKETPDYFEPFPVERVNNVKEREQSIALDFVNFDRDSELRAFYTLPDSRDYTLYQDFSFYVNPRFAMMDSTDEVEFYMRFVSNPSSDTLSYYEVSTILTENDPRRLPGPTPDAGGWLSFDVPVSSLSQIKVGVSESVAQDSFLVGPSDEQNGQTPPRVDIGKGLKATVRGTPSMSRVRRLTVGLRNKSGRDLPLGEVWYDELRMGDVRRDTGVAGIASANVILADLATFGLSYNATSADFLRLGQTTGSGTSVRANSFSTAINLHKFIEPLRLNMPLRMSWRNDVATPKFLQNSDIEYSGNLDSGTNISERGQQSYQLSIARDPRGYSPLWARYTIDLLRVGGSLTKSQNTLPTQVDTTESRTGNISYSLNLGGIRPIRLLNRLDFFPLPRSVTTDVSGGQSNRRRYTRELGQLGQSLRDSTVTKTGLLRFSTNFQPIRAVNYTYSEARDLIDGHYGADSSVVRLQTPQATVLGINLGRRTNQTHAASFNYSPGFAGMFRPRFTWSGGASLDNSPTNTSPRADSTITVANNNSTSSFNLTIPLGRLVGSLFSNSSMPMLMQATPGDTTLPLGGGGGGGPSAKDQLRTLFTRVIKVGDVQGSLQLRNTHNINGIHGTVPLAYKLGLSRDAGVGTTSFPVYSANSFAENFSEQTQWRGSTSIVVLNQISMDLTYQRSDRNSRAGAAGLGRVQRETTWPEIRFNWGSLHEKVPFLRKIFADFRPQSSNYRKASSETGTSDRPRETVTTTTGWTPLISFQGTLGGGWRTTFATDITKSETISDRQASAPVISLRSTNNYRMNFEKAFRRLSGTRTREITVNLDFGYNKITSRTEGAFVAEDVQDNLTLSGGTTVPFTRTISGTFRLNFAQNRQPNRGFTRSSLGLQFSTGFRF